jgi:hypothetical protein
MARAPAEHGHVDEAAGSGRQAEQPSESYNPWTVVNLVFHHLADQGLHPTFSNAGDPGQHAAELLRALGITPAAEGNRQDFRRTQDELAKIRATMFGEP